MIDKFNWEKFASALNIFPDKSLQLKNEFIDLIALTELDSMASVLCNIEHSLISHSIDDYSIHLDSKSVPNEKYEYQKCDNSKKKNFKLLSKYLQEADVVVKAMRKNARVKIDAKDNIPLANLKQNIQSARKAIGNSSDDDEPLQNKIEAKRNCLSAKNKNVGQQNKEVNGKLEIEFRKRKKVETQSEGEKSRKKRIKKVATPKQSNDTTKSKSSLQKPVQIKNISPKTQEINSKINTENHTLEKIMYELNNGRPR